MRRYQQYVRPYAGRIYVALAFVLALIGASGTDRPVEQLDPLPPRRQLRGHGPAVPQGHRLLRLQAAVPDLHRRLDPGHPDRDAGRHGRVPLLQRRDPAPAGPAPGAAARQGAHLGAAGPDRAGQGGWATSSSAGRSSTRRTATSTAPGTPTCTPACRPSCCSSSCRCSPRSSCSTTSASQGWTLPGPGHRDLGLRGPGRRHHLPGPAADAQGDAGAELARGALHPAQHHSHPGRLRVDQREGAPVPRLHEHHRQPDGGGQRPPSPTSGSGTPTRRISLQTFQRQQAIKSYYKFPALGVDRYTVGGQLTPVLIGVREISAANLPSPSWVNIHLQYTHGNGAARGPGQPDQLQATPSSPSRACRRPPRRGCPPSPSRRSTSGWASRATWWPTPSRPRWTTRTERDQRREPLLGHRRRPAVVDLHAGGLRPAAGRLQPADLEPDHRTSRGSCSSATRWRWPRRRRPSSASTTTPTR